MSCKYAKHSSQESILENRASDEHLWHGAIWHQIWKIYRSDMKIVFKAVKLHSFGCLMVYVASYPIAVWFSPFDSEIYESGR